MTPTEYEIRKLTAKSGAEQATVVACAALLRLKLPEQPDLRNAEIRAMEQALARVGRMRLRQAFSLRFSKTGKEYAKL